MDCDGVQGNGVLRGADGCESGVYERWLCLV